MKSGLFVGLGLSLGLALTAPVDATAQSTTSLTPVGLGSLDAVLQFCGHINPAGAAAYAALEVSLIGQQSAATLTVLKNTAEYKSAFNQVRGVMVSAPRDWARHSCLGIVSAGAKG